MALAAGEIVTADQYNRDTEKIVNRARRVTTSGNATTTGVATAVLRLDDTTIAGGYLYGIRTSSLALQASAVGTYCRAQIHYTTDGSTPTTSSSVLPGAVTQTISAVVSQSINSPILGLYSPGSDEVLSLLLSIVRTGGTAGNVTIFADATNTIDMWIENLGLDPGDSGVDL
jgi:hypothetical protein